MLFKFKKFPTPEQSLRFVQVLSASSIAVAALGIACPTMCSAAPQVLLGKTSVVISTPNYKLTCSLTNGEWDAVWGQGDSAQSLNDISCGANLKDGSVLDSGRYISHICQPGDVKNTNGAFGPCTEIIVHHRTAGMPELRQQFIVSDKLPYFLTSVSVVSPTSISTNHIDVISSTSADASDSGVHLADGGVPQTVSVPYDNDAFVRYSSSGSHSSYELTAIYDNTSRNGFVLGSVTHDTWKTGLTFDAISNRTVGDLSVFGGVADKGTRDTQPHGYVSGLSVSSPTVFVGYFPDWRTGLEQYGQANARIHPPLKWNEGVPFGWNSWMAYETKISSAAYLGISDFYKTSLEPNNFSNKGVVYINFDSFWDNLSDAQLKAAVDHVHANGQKAGIYWTPFVCWGPDFQQTVEGTDGAYKYADVIMRADDGKPLPRLDSGEPIDPTSPGALKRIDSELARFVNLGFDYIKLDFMSHGDMEGHHYDPKVTTGTQAYNVGMKRIVDDLDEKKVGRPIFISLSIAPLFPSGYAHSRRIACDTWGWLANSEYMLNSLNYGWWEEGPLYRFNDPDNTELIEKSPLTTEDEGKTRFNSNVIAGTVLLDSDQLLDPVTQARAMKFLTNPEVDALARTGHSFYPVEGDTGSEADDKFVYPDHKTGAFYIAVFNYSGSSPKTMTLDLARLGLNPNVSYTVHDLWSHTDSSATGTLSINLLPAQSTIVRLTPLRDSGVEADAR